MQIPGAIRPNSRAIRVCDSEEDQTECRESYLHIRRQCSSSYWRDHVKRLRGEERPRWLPLHYLQWREHVWCFFILNPLT